MGVLHFLDVGQGDCSILEHRSGRVSMLDVCKARAVRPAARSPYGPLSSASTAALGLLASMPPRQTLTPAARDLLNALMPPPPDYVNPIDYMRARNIHVLFRYMQSHTDMDHLDGIADLCAEFPPLNFWDTANTCRKDDGFGFGGFRREDWDYYKSIRDGTIIDGPRRLVLYAGDQGPYYNALSVPGEMHDGLYVLAPTRDLVQAANDSQDFNDCSYVILWLTPAGRILFCGDSHDKTWEHVLANYRDYLVGVELMIAPHHGRDSGRDREFLSEIRPKLTLFGRAPSEHLMYGAWNKRGLKYITANQAGTVIVDASSTDMHVYVAKESCARKQLAFTFYAEALRAWYWGTVSAVRAAA